MGDNTSLGKRLAPVAVNRDPGVSALHGKTVVAVAAGDGHSTALCSDGTVATWGTQLTNSSLVPVAMSTAPGVSALSGKSVVAIAAGYGHTLALCSDGSVAAWGDNSYGQLGDNTTINRPVPVAVNTTAGISALAGKTLVAIAAGAWHSLALCSDGTVVAWGHGGMGSLGDNTGATCLTPVTVNTSPGVSALSGKIVVAIAAGGFCSLGVCSDGTLAAWGYGQWGAVGDNTGWTRYAPVAVNQTALAPGERFIRLASSSYSVHALALVAASPLEVCFGVGAAQLDLALRTNGLPVGLSRTSSTPITVTFRCEGQGGLLTNGTLTFAAGETAQTLRLPTVNPNRCDLLRVSLDEVTGPWTIATTTSPYLEVPTGARKFFRLRQL